MREILFRGKDINTNNWIYGNFNKVQKLDNSGYEFLIIEIPANFSTHSVVPETVGQYTGLKDKNGTKIFEGDILDTTNSNCRIWYVDYKKTSFCANQTNCNFSIALEQIINSSNVEVIGNIHDNPELLKGE